jgi:hypothetical protein
MVIASRAVKKLRSDLAEVNKEINDRIIKLEKMPTAGKQGYLELKKIFSDREASAEAKFRKSLMASGVEVWDFAWANVWEAFREFQKQASPVTRQNYEGLESGLRAKQSYLMAVLNLPEMFGDQVWTEVWTMVWSAVGAANERYKRGVTEELLRADAELPDLLAKQLDLQNQIERAKAGDKIYGGFR